jgi:hypothetical protein
MATGGRDLDAAARPRRAPSVSIRTRALFEADERQDLEVVPVEPLDSSEAARKPARVQTDET